VGVAQVRGVKVSAKKKDRRPRGEEKPQAKLTENDVRMLRWLHKNKNVSVVALAAHYHVGKSTVDQAIKRITWRHVLDYEELGVVPDYKEITLA
jgi:predicted DNA-binding protein YlxM (UPF0122 family)